ncbi:MFS transporter [Trueperella pecoris]|uniref:MFS transporter n=1 Tax=Trueperella pecoris TaxID=2733571 RepID=A0A7M1QYL3_9ACTO|nr:MFS transporter [Trueperella pecoris]QOR47119.1 MFS transporter [Trueperella pecoris]
MAGNENVPEAKPVALWSQSGYLSWLTVDTAFGVSGAVNSFVFSLVVISATGSPAQAGVVASISLVSAGVFQFFGGWVQDFFDRRTVAIWCAITGIVLFAVGALLLAMNTFTFLTASIFAVAIGVRAGLTGGVTNIMLRAFIEPHLLSRAMSVNQARDAVVEFGVAPFAGALLQLGRVFPWMFNVVANAIGLIACFFCLNRFRVRVSKGPTRRKN